MERGGQRKAYVSLLRIQKFVRNDTLDNSGKTKYKRTTESVIGDIATKISLVYFPINVGYNKSIEREPLLSPRHRMGWIGQDKEKGVRWKNKSTDEGLGGKGGGGGGWD